MSKWRVTTAEASYIVEADYFRVDAGALVFRKNRINPQAYPEVVFIFADGCWRHVERVAA